MGEGREGGVKAGTIQFALRLAGALHQYGVPAHRLEQAMNSIDRRLKIDGQFFSSPTALMATVGQDHKQRTYIVRPGEEDLNLEKLDRIDRLAKGVARGKIQPEEGTLVIDGIVRAPERYGPFITLLCFALTSGGAARLFGGGWREILVGTLIGLYVGILIMAAGRFSALGRVLFPLAAFGAVILARSAVLLFGAYATHIATVTGLIVLIPGLSLTLAMTEMATGHYVSGTARLAKATVLFLMIGFGVALGSKIQQVLPPLTLVDAPLPLPSWTEWVALALVPPGFVVLFKAHPKDTPWIFIAGLLSFFSARMGSVVLGPELGVFLAALLLGLLGNGFARFFDRPAAIPMVPGIMLLVPGTIGFKSLSSLLAHHTLAGMETAFTMLLVAISLVAGLLFANVILEPKRPI